MQVFRLACLLASIIVAASALNVQPEPAPISYDGYKVYRVKTGKQLKPILEKIAHLSSQPWNSNIDKHLDVAVAAQHVLEFESIDLPDCKLMHTDLGELITKQEQAPSSIYKRQVDDDAWYDSYHPYEDHIAYWADLQASFANQSAKFSSGTSYEGRDIFGYHFWGAGGPGKPAILYHSNVHAREWIASMTTEYITRELITGYKAADDLCRYILDTYDLYVVPFANPDGFVYTQTTDRLWRKNRMPPPPPPANQSCWGVDNNRNWPFAWDANSRGAATDPCDDAYRGEAPLSAPENVGLAAFVDRLRDGPGIKLFVDWHSFGELILYPFGSNETVYAPSLGKWHKTAADTAYAIRDASDVDVQYVFGPGGATLYTATGVSVDHVYAVGGAEFSYLIECRDYDNYQFLLPPEQIRGNVVEQWAGQQVMLAYLDEEFFDGDGP